MGVIYKTVNKTNGRWYIGKDQQNNKNYLGSGKVLIQAIKKYGKENFEKTILVETNSNIKLVKLEKHFIKKFNAVVDPKSYNIAEGGRGGNLIAGYTDKERKIHGEKIKNGQKNMSEEAKKERSRKQAIASTGRTYPPRSKECRAKLRAARLGTKHTDETKRQMSIDRKGIKRSQEFCEKQSRARKGKSQPKLRKTYKLIPINGSEEIITSNLKETCSLLQLSYQGMFDQKRINRPHKGWMMQEIKT